MRARAAAPPLQRIIHREENTLQAMCVAAGGVAIGGTIAVAGDMAVAGSAAVAGGGLGLGGSSGDEAETLRT